VRVPRARAVHRTGRPSWAARAAPAEAELGRTPAWLWAVLAGRASAVNTGHARVAVSRARAVQLGRARFWPSDIRISFSIF
jgi:hypothetical protein